LTAVRNVLCLILVAVLPGCATLSESQCLSGDWFGVGDADARAGYSPDRLAAHEQACAKHGVGVDPDGYRAGYTQGLVVFCVPPEAFALGRRGATYYRQCPPGVERDFIPAYELGVDLHAIEQDLVRIDVEIARLRDEIDDDKTSPVSRDIAGASLRQVKDERERREYDRMRLIDRARERGYGEVW
jgi:hypothetical protein